MSAVKMGRGKHWTEEEIKVLREMPEHGKMRKRFMKAENFLTEPMKPLENSLA
jgi:hypothetical protein